MGKTQVQRCSACKQTGHNRRRCPGSPTRSSATAPPGWDELVAAVARPPRDPSQWASWARAGLSEIAVFALRHPEMASSYRESLGEFRVALKAAMASRQEDLIYNALQTLKDDLAELEDPGPQTVPIKPRRRRRRRRREGETLREFADRLKEGADEVGDEEE